jgi:hypothetical protein
MVWTSPPPSGPATLLCLPLKLAIAMGAVPRGADVRAMRNAPDPGATAEPALLDAEGASLHRRG